MNISRKEIVTMKPSYVMGFTTLDKEVSIDSLPVKGNLPKWLSGTLVRNGPGKHEVGEHKYKHWFDGLAMLHAFSFANGKVSYANKFLESEAYKYAKTNNQIGYQEFATDPCRSIFKRFQQMFSTKITDNALVNISKLADQFVALTETPLPIAFDPKTLKTIGVYDYEDSIKGQTTTAHPHFDFDAKEGVNYVTHIARNSTYQIYRFPAGSRRREIVAKLEVPAASYMHSFGLSKNYVILSEFPFILNQYSMLFSGMTGKTFCESLKWKPEQGTRFIVFSRKTGEVKGIYKTDACFAFHHINSFEDGKGNLIVDMSTYPDASIVKMLYLDVLRGEHGSLGEQGVTAGEFRRYTIALEKGTVSSETIIDELVELPRINYEKHNTKDYSFVYCAGSGKVNEQRQDYSFLDRLLKVDVKKKTYLKWQEADCAPGEPVFIASPNSQSEDDGIILSVILDINKSTSFLLALDAKSFTEIARAELPHHVPFGFHGQFFNV